MMLVIAALAVAAPLLGLALFFLWQRRRPPEEKPTYRLNRKTLAVAVLTEILVAGAGMLGVFVWASQYGNDEATRWLMIAVGLIFAGFEAARIPCAINVRTQASRFLCGLAVSGVVASAGMDAIALIQVQTPVVEQRLSKVHAAGAVLDELRDVKAGNGEAIKLAQDAVAKATTVFEQAQARLRAASADLGRLPQCRNCGTGASAGVMRENLREAAKAVEVAKKDLDAANLRLARVDPTKGSEAVRLAEKAFLEAVSSSQLHMLAGAFLGTDASKVSDEQVGVAKRIVIVAPALLASLIGSLLSMLAVSPIRRDTIEVPDKTMVAAWPQMLKAAEDILAPAAQAVAEAKRAKAGKPTNDVSADVPKGDEPALDENPKTQTPPEPEKPPAKEDAVVTPVKRERKTRKMRRAEAAKAASGARASPWAGVPPEPATENDAVVTPFPQKRKGEST
jgi:hypothetical protein